MNLIFGKVSDNICDQPQQIFKNQEMKELNAIQKLNT